MMPVCEICKGTIREHDCIWLDPFDHRYAHTYCFREIITGAFQNITGTADDDISEMVADACEDRLIDRTPNLPEVKYEGGI